MKFKAFLLIAGFLLTMTAVAATPEDISVLPADQDEAVAAPKLDDETVATPDQGCQDDSAPLVAMDWQNQEVQAASQTCGACSSSNCQGALRGQLCWLGSGSGWGNCNIYSGGFRCPTGGWECQCGSGPLP